MPEHLMRPTTDLVLGLARLASRLPPNSRMVEIGSYRGESAVIFLMAGVAHIYCVDPWEPGYDVMDSTSFLDFEDVERGFDQRMAHSLYADKFTKMKMTSSEAAGHFDGAYLDAVYIDGNHQEAAVAEDIRLWLPKIRPGGVIAGHDFDTWRGVQRAVEAALGRPDEIFEDSSWMKRV